MNPLLKPWQGLLWRRVPRCRLEVLGPLTKCEIRVVLLQLFLEQVKMTLRFPWQPTTCFLKPCQENKCVFLNEVQVSQQSKSHKGPGLLTPHCHSRGGTCLPCAAEGAQVEGECLMGCWWLCKVLVTDGLAQSSRWVEGLHGGFFMVVKTSLAFSYLWLITAFSNLFQDRKLEEEFTLDENNFLKLGIFQEL